MLPLTHSNTHKDITALKYKLCYLPEYMSLQMADLDIKVAYHFLCQLISLYCHVLAASFVMLVLFGGENLLQQPITCGLNVI